MNLVLGSFLAAAAAARAFVSLRPVEALSIPSSMFSRDLIHSFAAALDYYYGRQGEQGGHTISSTYQLRLWPLLAASARRRFVRKCQSR